MPLQEKDLREMAERMVRMETKMDHFIIRSEEIDKVRDEVERVKEIANRAENKADSAIDRLSRTDKWVYTIGGTTITTIVVAILNLILK